MNINADDFVPSTQLFLRMCSAVHFCFHRIATYPEQSQCLRCLTQAVCSHNGTFSLSAMRPDTTAAYGSLLGEHGGFFLTTGLFVCFFLPFPNSLSEMTFLENACVKINEEKKTGNNQHKTSSQLIP